MLAQIPDLKRKILVVFLLAAATGLVSCASQKEQVAIVNDPDAKPESQLPWNKQEKWENGSSQLSGITDRR